MTQLPSPIKTDLRMAARVDYFATDAEARAVAAALTAQGYNAHAYNTGPDPEGSRFEGLYGVWIADRPESWFYTGPGAAA